MHGKPWTLEEEDRCREMLERGEPLEANLFKTTSDQFHVKVATDITEACALVEAGFEFVTGEYNDGGKIFRKRK